MLHNLFQIAQSYIQSTSILAYPVVLLAGVATSFTPCVYPVLPIIVGFIGGQGSRSKMSGFVLSSAYVLGMAITYSFLGAFAALSGMLFGQIQNNPVAYLIIANIIIFFSLSTLGLFSLPMPSFLSRSGSGKVRQGVIGAFGLGLASGLITAPCTVAILGVLLTYIASQQNLVFGISLLFTYALGMGFLLILAGTFTGLLTALPKSGVWMKRAQTVFGLFMLALGEYYLIQAGRLWL
ncbi:MAG: cytochrome c biogenesis protein CcdA [Spirochaetota bacterium]